MTLYVRDLFGLKRAPEFDDWLVSLDWPVPTFALPATRGCFPILPPPDRQPSRAPQQPFGRSGVNWPPQS